MLKTPSLVAVRPARAEDVGSMARIIDDYARRRAMLARRENDLLRSLDDFVVACRETEAGRVIGCGALTLYSTRIAEIRSVAVDPAHSRSGAGRKIVQALVDRAKSIEARRVYLLTLVPEFFAKMGFEIVDSDNTSLSYLSEAVLDQSRTFANKALMMRDL